MKRLYAAVTTLVVVWSVAMSFFALSAYDDDWVWAVVGVLILVAFAGLGGLLVPPARTRLPAGDRAASWFMQFFGALITTELLTAALIAWIMGNRTHHGNNAYQVLGLLILLALLGVGQGVPVTFVIFRSKVTGGVAAEADRAERSTGVPPIAASH
jgi:hypothetical protein